MKTLEQLGVSPTPWSVTPNNFESEDVTANDSTVVVAYEPTFEEAKDSINKRLIAAAPDLYEALAAMLSCAEKEAPFTTGSGMSIAMDMARKAIKKAGGEE